MKGIRVEIIYAMRSGNMKRHFLLPEVWFLNSMPERSCILLHRVLKRVGNKVLLVFKNSSPHKRFAQFNTC